MTDDDRLRILADAATDRVICCVRELLGAMPECLYEQLMDNLQSTYGHESTDAKDLVKKTIAGLALIGLNCISQDDPLADGEDAPA